ncbi:MAG: endonuclease NucS [Thermoproteota archaeon]|nr:endonuclease NucS [Thermoproteota archaeon]
MANKKSSDVQENPSVDEAEKLVKKALSKRKPLILVGNCWVDYHGRASSQLEPGERIVLVKQDGSLLVHRPSGYEPVNWQPPGCLFQTKVEDGVLQIRAIRRKPAESVKVFFNRIYLAATFTLVDAGEFSLYASEQDMQKAILTEPSLLEEGFQPITYEKKVEPGFVDVYGVDGKGRLVVVEIKRKTAGRDAALQLAKYVKSVKETTSRQVRGVLAAPKMAKGVQRLLATLELEFHALSPKKCAETLSRPKTKKLAEYFEE